MRIDRIKAFDSEIAEAILKELDRERSKIELIASENFVSPAVQDCCHKSKSVSRLSHR